ncbi:T9SS type A sorting domain-containing protein [Bacteroidota bacterium]
MRIKIFILFIIIITGAWHTVPLQAQDELPDTVWSIAVNNYGYVNDVKFSPDGQYIYLGTRYDVLKIETITGNIVDTFALNRPLMKSLNLSPSGDTLIVSGNGKIMLFNVYNDDTIFTLNYGDEACITPDGKRIIAIAGEQILIIDIESKEIIETLIGEYKYLSHLRISPDGKYFSLSGYNSFLMDMTTYEEIKKIDDSRIFGFSPDNKMIGTVSSGGIYLLDLETFGVIKNIKYYDTNNVKDRGIGPIIFSNDSKYLIYGFFDHDDYTPNKIIVWNIEKDTLEYEYSFSGQKLIDISKDDYIASVGYSFYYKEFCLFLLRPKWNGTDVKDLLENELDYTINNGILRIQFDENLTEEPVINIYNILGMNVRVRHAVPQQHNGNMLEMDINFLIPGVYFVVVDVGGERFVIKILR